MNRSTDFTVFCLESYKLPENAQFNVDLKGSSGESNNLIKVETSSGNLMINKR